MIIYLFPQFLQARIHPENIFIGTIPWLFRKQCHFRLPVSPAMHVWNDVISRPADSLQSQRTEN